jgi:putative membrane protein
MCAWMAGVLLITGIFPEQRFDWWLESTLAITFLVVLISTYRRLPLSDVSYLLIVVFLSLHEWGAQFKYTDVPLGEWMKELLGTRRNHYDRIMHFNYGLLLAYPMQEWFMRAAGVWSKWRYLLSIQMTLACSAVYEMLETFMSFVLSPERGEEFVGMQGDFWDSQKDMFLACMGSMVAMGVVAVARRRRRSRWTVERDSVYAAAA